MRCAAAAADSAQNDVDLITGWPSWLDTLVRLSVDDAGRGVTHRRHRVTYAPDKLHY